MIAPAPPSRDTSKSFQRRASTLQHALRRSAPAAVGGGEYSEKTPAPPPRGGAVANGDINDENVQNKQPRSNAFGDEDEYKRKGQYRQQPHQQQQQRRTSQGGKQRGDPKYQEFQSTTSAGRPVNFNPSPIIGADDIPAKYTRASRGNRGGRSPPAEQQYNEQYYDDGVPVPGAAGTATRTLREQVAMLQQSKEELDVEARVKDAEIETLRTRLKNLEAVLLEDLDQRISAAISAANSTWRSPNSTSPTGKADNAAFTQSLKNLSPTASQLFSSIENGTKNLNGNQIWVQNPESPEKGCPLTPEQISSTILPKGMASPGGGAIARQMKEADSLRKELSRSNENYDALMQDYEALEQTLLDVQRTASGYASRYAFCLLDEDHDGLIGLEEVMRYELFLPYSISVLQHCYTHWHFMEVPGRMNSEDFLNFTQFAEDKTSRASQLFWFRCADIDGDGYIGRHDMRWLYDQVDKSGGCIGFDDLYQQIIDMAQPADPPRGLTLADIRACKLGTGIFSLLFNHKNLLLRRTTAEFSLRNDVPM
mmetsp:Transcript_1278/g.1498  ORF Transcript_1278/g.1498 Transcript_1278/m.1498 type:complete len:538 (-) Transcript_1278:1109-2722(-)|eukprot:CAMPEP_0197848528 /NCGR_PEP_ID=MMETSP1438-20131217/8995_1 /TAXON_ID=1461541 /ORGANISM="Pterosperma sp., Strain CCMP1384" /LENGTH=537 /DNA_ID=CAMNT_0043460815 /DNA_START=383 /DNA_END=1996 /DNA_ORIENTATION=-